MLQPVIYRAGHTETLPAGKAGDWIQVCRINEIRPDRARTVLVQGVELIVVRENTGPNDPELVHALGGRCPYRDAPLTEAELVDGLLICPLHGCDFEPHSGRSLSDPDMHLPRFPTRVHAGLVSVLITERGPGVPDTYLGRWSRRRAVEPELHHVHALATDRTPHPAAALHKRANTASFDDLRFLPAGIAAPPLPPTAPVDTTTVIGQQAAQPMQLSTPILIGHLGYGPVSIEAKVALARGARAAGTAIGSGDGGAHGRERDASGAYVVQVLPGQRPQELEDAAAIELRIGDSRNPASPITLPANAVSTEVGLHRDLLPNVAHVGPLYQGQDQLIADVTYLRGTSNGIPIGIKISAGALEADLAVAIKAGLDFVTVDAAPLTAALSTSQAHLGIPALAALARARAFLDRTAAPISLIIAGGFYRGDQVAKALALGADAVAISNAAMWAIGCQGYQACESGGCPVGIATQEPALRLRLNADISARRLSTYLDALTGQVADYCRMVGVATSRDLNRSHIVCVDEATAFATGVKTTFAAVTD